MCNCVDKNERSCYNILVSESQVVDACSSGGMGFRTEGKVVTLSQLNDMSALTQLTGTKFPHKNL